MAILFALALIVFDFITGIIKAIKTKSFSSSVMREGLFHKIGSVCTIILGIIADIGQQYVDIGLDFDLPIVKAICGYIVIMEIGSSFENIGEISPRIKNSRIASIFAKLNRGDKE
jgi:toxin secretion/phage lysis holin